MLVYGVATPVRDYTSVHNTDRKGDSMVIKKGKRERIDTKSSKRFVKRNQEGTFKESVDVGRSLAADRRSDSKTKVKPGYGDQGDQPKRVTTKAAKSAKKK